MSQDKAYSNYPALKIERDRSGCNVSITNEIGHAVDSAFVRSDVSASRRQQFPLPYLNSRSIVNKPNIKSTTLI
jgi:hypothetical protein